MRRVCLRTLALLGMLCTGQKVQSMLLRPSLWLQSWDEQGTETDPAPVQYSGITRHSIFLIAALPRSVPKNHALGGHQKGQVSGFVIRPGRDQEVLHQAHLLACVSLSFHAWLPCLAPGPCEEATFFPVKIGAQTLETYATSPP